MWILQLQQLQKKSAKSTNHNNFLQRMNNLKKWKTKTKLCVFSSRNLNSLYLKEQFIHGAAIYWEKYYWLPLKMCKIWRIKEDPELQSSDFTDQPRWVEVAMMVVVSSGGRGFVDFMTFRVAPKLTAHNSQPTVNPLLRTSCLLQSSHKQKEA